MRSLDIWFINASKTLSGPLPEISEFLKSGIEEHPNRVDLAITALIICNRQQNHELVNLWLNQLSIWGIHHSIVVKYLISDIQECIERAYHLNVVAEELIDQTFGYRGDIAVKNSHKKRFNSCHIANHYNRQKKRLPINSNETLLWEVLPDQEEIPKLTGSLVSDNHMKQFDALLKDSQRELKEWFSTEFSSNVQQLESYLRIQNFFNHGSYLPAMHGWPVSPDFAFFLIDTINSQHYDAIIEFGSGTSTVLIAKTVNSIKKSSTISNRKTKQLAFEHLEQYYSRTRDALRKEGLMDEVALFLAPLKPVDLLDETYLYYDCLEALAELNTYLIDDNLSILVIVDGPPGKTGRHARYPALPIVLENIRFRSIDFLLDDYARKDEQEIVDQWTAHLSAKSEMTFSKSCIKMEKDACLLSVVCIEPIT